MSDSVRPHSWQPTRLPRPWDSPGKNTGVGCHFLLQRMKVKSEGEVAQSCLTLSDPMDYSLPDSSIHGIFQARVLEWVAIAFSENAKLNLSKCNHILNASWYSSFQCCRLFYHVWKWSESEVAQSCPTLCNPMDCSLLGSSIHGILQARILEWVAISFSRRSSQPRNQTQVSCISGRHFTVWATREALYHV